MRDDKSEKGPSVFADKSLIKANQVLRKFLSKLDSIASLYDILSLRILRSSDLIKAGVSTDEIKILGQWRSNTQNIKE